MRRSEPVASSVAYHPDEHQRAEQLAMFAHDIKNPLSIIVGYAEMLIDRARERGDGEDERLLQRLQSHSLTVRTLVANYLDCIREEAGQLVLHKRQVAVDDLLRRIVEQYLPEAQSSGISLELSLQDELPSVNGDPVALERIVTNLIHNALKYSSASEQVIVRSFRQSGHVVIAVADTGPGIVAEELPTIFDKYHRATAAQSYEGGGLGLFIAKTFVEAHGGYITVDSTLGVGSCFSVFLPLPAETEQSGYQALPDGPPARTPS